MTSRRLPAALGVAALVVLVACTSSGAATTDELLQKL